MGFQHLHNYLVLLKSKTRSAELQLTMVFTLHNNQDIQESNLQLLAQWPQSSNEWDSPMDLALLK